VPRPLSSRWPSNQPTKVATGRTSASVLYSAACSVKDFLPRHQVQFNRIAVSSIGRIHNAGAAVQIDATHETWVTADMFCETHGW